MSKVHTSVLPKNLPAAKRDYRAPTQVSQILVDSGSARVDYYRLGEKREVSPDESWKIGTFKKGGIAAYITEQQYLCTRPCTHVRWSEWQRKKEGIHFRNRETDLNPGGS